MFVLGRPLQRVLTFTGKARGLPQRGAPEKCFAFIMTKKQLIAFSTGGNVIELFFVLTE